MKSFLVKNKSNIDGKGVFTNYDIKKGIVFYEIPINCIFDKAKSKCAYIGKGHWVYDNNVLNYINHSCSSNTILDISQIPRLIAKRNIKIGEEITVNYNKTEKDGKKFLCKCGAKNCKKYFLKIE